MKILYIDLDPSGLPEDYSINPRRYGGGAVIARYMKEYSPHFYIMAREECFDNVGANENRTACLSVPPIFIKEIVSGAPLIDLYSDLFSSYDLIFLSNPTVVLNTQGLKAKQCAWACGYSEMIHPKLEHLFLYNDFQSPQLQGNTQVHKIIIGKPLPEIKEEEREPILFQCSRHDGVIHSIPIAEWCKANKIKGYFAGIIGPNYRLLDHIDNNWTFFLGEISDSDKTHFLRKSTLTTQIHTWPTPFSLSAVESLACGTPVFCRDIGFWPSLIEHGKNGFFAERISLMDAFQRGKTIDRDYCRSVAEKYTEKEMCKSVIKACEEIKI